MKPRIFISAVTRELKTARQLVANTLLALGYEPVWQDIFELSSNDIRPMLRKQIDSCSAVLQIVGDAYGAEPPTPDETFGRVSYTQYEALYAKSQGKPVYYLIAQADLPRDAAAETVDVPRDASATAQADVTERRANQQRYRETVQSTEHIFYAVQSHPETELSVRKLQKTLEELNIAFRWWQAKVLIGLASIAAIVLVLVGLAIHNAGQQKTIENTVTTTHKETVQEIKAAKEETKEVIKTEIEKSFTALTNPAVLAERIRKEITQTAEDKIKALPDVQGRGLKIAEIEKERDIALNRVDDLIKIIQEGLKEGAVPVFQRAAEILEKEGINATLKYLESRREETLKSVFLHSERAKSAQANADAEKVQRNKSLQPLVLEAELNESKFQFAAALKLREQIADFAPDWFIARNSLGIIYDYLAMHAEAEPNFLAAVKLAGKPEEVATALNNLAQLYKATNRSTEAEPLMEQTLKITESAFGNEHPIVAIRLNNLAQLYKDTNRLKEAEPLMERALHIDEIAFGNEHPNVARDLNNLANLYQITNRLQEAEPLMKRALKIDEVGFGKNNPIVAIRLNNLAMLYRDTNRFTDAEQLMTRALEIVETAFGKEHPQVAISLNNLAQLYDASNRLKEAEPLMKRALHIDEAIFGKDHPSVARDLNNLALLYKATNRLKEAEPLMERALQIDETTLGKEHPTVAIDINNLAQLYQATNRMTEAEPLIKRVLKIFEMSYGEKHPNVAIALNNLAELYRETNRLTEAEPLYVRALQINEATFGKEAPSVALNLNNLSLLYQSKNRLTEAEPLMQRALAIFVKSFGTEHPNSQKIKTNYSALLGAMKLESSEIVKRLDSVATLLEIADTLNSAGIGAFKAGEWKAATNYYEEAIKRYEKLPNATSELLRTKVNLAAARREMGEVVEAKVELVVAISKLNKQIPEAAVIKGRARYHLAICDHKLKNFAAAEKMALASIQQYDLLPAKDAAGAAPLRKQSVELYRQSLESQGITPKEIEAKMQELIGTADQPPQD